MKKKVLLLFVVLSISIGCQRFYGQHDTFIEKFSEKYGDFSAQWKDGMNTPHRVICRPINLSEGIKNFSHLESLLRQFIRENREMLAINEADIKLISIQKPKDTWYVSFIQTFKGMEVLDSEIIFRVNENGNLFVFGFDFYNDIQVQKENLISKNHVESILKDHYKKSLGEITISIQDYIKIYPMRKGKDFVYRPVYLTNVSNGNDLNEIVLVDGFTSKIIESINKSHHVDVTGNVKGLVLPLIATDVPELQNFENLIVNIDGNQVITDESGDFSYSITGSSATLIAQLKGLFVDVNNFNQTDANISQTVQQNDVINLVWDDSNSDMAERNVFYHINKIHKNNKLVDPNFTNLDYPLQCIVNDTGSNAPCNAFWNGTNLHFGVQASGCSMNSAHGASVIYHEYGHAINDKLYNQAGVNIGLRSHTLHEAFADIYACLLVDDSRFALGWYGPGTFTRNLNNNNSYPTNVVGQQHTDGLILGGAFWDLRLLTSPELAYELAHFAKYGTPDDSDLGVAFSEVYLETLIADDDDGNLLNGTPNSNAIENAFCQHGIGSNLFAIQQVNHTPIENTLDTTNNYKVEINLPSSPFISEALDMMNLVYTTNNFNTSLTTEFTQVNTTDYEAFIPAQPEGTLIKYYFEILNGNCGTDLRHPSRDFLNENYSFYIGEYVAVFEDNFEIDQGWQYGDASDNATSGFWERGNPQLTIDDTGFQVQPEEDYSTNGVNCLTTGAAQGTFWYSNDVDTGKTTVTSPVFSNLDDTSIVTFYKWFVHGAGFVFPAQGQWKMEITNNSVNWIPVENTTYGDHRKWIKSSYKFSDFVSITDQMQVRFIASDFGAGSIVEGLVDDFSIVTLDNFFGINEQPNYQEVIIYPNPTSGVLTISSELNSIDQLKIYNLLGQKLLDMENVEYTLDLSSLSKGVYFLEIVSSKEKLIKKFIKN